MCGEFAERTSTSARKTASILPVAPNSRVLVVVAHPDDETLWAGGTMLLRPNWSWRVVSVCRGNDHDRRPKFFAAVERLGGSGSIGDVDDAPEQRPLPDSLVQNAIVSQLDTAGFDLMVTHSPFGEYTRHIRHEEVGRAVLELWRAGELSAKELWMFAYSDNANAHYPTAIVAAHLGVSLPEDIWRAKVAIIRSVYGFAADSWEAMTTPTREAFWRFYRPAEALCWQRAQATRVTAENIGGVAVQRRTS